MSRVKLDCNNYCHKPMRGGGQVEGAIEAAAKRGVDGLREYLAGRRLEDLRAGYGLTVLHALSRPKSGTRTDRRALSAILDFGIDVNVVDNKQQTALHRAAETGSWWMIEPLLRAGADLELDTEKGETALSLARKFCARVPGEDGVAMILRLASQIQCQRLERDTPSIQRPVRKNAMRL